MKNDLIFKAITFAAHAHRNQRRRYHGIPYINHLLRVTEKAVSSGLPDEAIMAAVLHDVLEDTDTTEKNLEEHFSADVILLVKLLTKWWPDGAKGPEVAIYKKKYYEAILENDQATNLKLLDRADNVSDFATSLPEAEAEARKYLGESEMEFPRLFEKSKNEKVKALYLESMEILRKAISSSTRNKE
jgi:(p)ppGpp synthase/HD superfamily hydrolase